MCSHSSSSVQARRTESLPDRGSGPPWYVIIALHTRQHVSSVRPSSEVAWRCTQAAKSAAAPAPPAEVLSLRSANRPIERETFSFCISEVTAATAKWYQFGTIHTLRPHQSYNSSDLAKNVDCLQNGSHMLLSLLASSSKTSMKQDKSKSTVACAIHFASTQHF